MTAEAGTVCAVKQSSLGMESQPAGVEQAGVVQPPEVAGAPVERGQDEAGNGRQGEQQQHLRALRRIWYLRSTACRTLRQELGRVEEHGRKFPEQGRRQYRHEDLLRPGELGRSSSLSSHLGGGDMKADEKGTMGDNIRGEGGGEDFLRYFNGTVWVLMGVVEFFWKSSSACKADLRRSLIFASFKEVDLAAMSEGSHHRDDHRFLQTPRKSQLTLLQRRRPAKTCCAYVSIPGLSQVPVSQISVSSLPFPGSVSPHPSPPSSSRHSLHPGSRQSRAWAALHVSGGRHRFWSPVTTSGLRGPFTIVFSLEREERHNKAPDLARVKPWQWPGRGPSSRSNEAHPSVLRARAWACGTRERSGQKLSAIVNDSNPISYVCEGEGKPNKDAGVSEKVPSDNALARENKKNPLRLAIEARERGRSRGIQSRRHMRVEGVRVMGKVMVMGTSRSKGVSEREIVGSKCLPNRCPREKDPSDVWDEGGFNGVRVHVVFESMQDDGEGLDVEGEGPLVFGAGEREREGETGRQETEEKETGDGTWERERRWLEDFLSVRERDRGREKETERRRDGESLGETERALERILGKILGVTQITDEFSISDSHSEIY
ncbi:hypothetical protein BJV77DRAFT_963369 [Russula vinacea]|nr:hypothetical protein BJV77DRAFT_963369 [Russula vinacea]